MEETLQGVRFFEFLTEEEREEFAEASEPVSFDPGENIIEEGAEQGSLFVLTSGMVEVRKGLPGGRSRLLAEIDTSRGRTVVGERGLLGESGASATVRAVGEVEAIKIPRDTSGVWSQKAGLPRSSSPTASPAPSRGGLPVLTRRSWRRSGSSRQGETDMEAFRDRLITDWSV